MSSTHGPLEGGPSNPRRPRYTSTQAYRPLVPPATVEDRDACALYASVRKDGKPSHAPIPLALDALGQMLHRAGNIDGEGDGCGMQIDIPRKIWAEEIRKDGHAASLALDEKFAVAHIFIPRTGAVKNVQHDAREIMSAAGLRVLAEREGIVDSSALGPTAREEEPVFWQVGGLIDGARACFELMVELEEKLDVHVASLSHHTVVYKVMGAPQALGKYFPDLTDERLETVAVLGHNRYSTNTWPSFKRVQPFGIIGHNGEINTIVQLREEARLLGVPIHADGSDSQDFNRTLETFIHRDGLSLVEAMELVLPPIVNEIRYLSPELSHFYMYLRQVFGPFTQGPVALIGRDGSECVFSTDALGLRPLWQVETVDDFIFSSEPGVAPLAETVSEPKPLAPGEKVLVQIGDGGSRLREHDEVQRLAYERWLKRVGSDKVPSYDTALLTGGPTEGPDIPGYAHAGPSEPVKVSDHVLGGFGWLREDMKLIQQMASNGAEPIGSLGYDGPLAALNPERQNLADYFKETVAVVTNPAIDREREIEHFSCRTVFGARPQPNEPIPEPGTVELSFPIVLGGHHHMAPLSAKTLRNIARDHKTFLLEDLWEEFPGARSAVLDIACLESENTKGAIERLKFEAIDLVRGGAELIVLSDRTVYEGERRYIDPHLAVAAIDAALKTAKTDDEPNLRRRTSLVLRSGALRNVHDVMVALGLGADGVCPYVMFEVACVDDYEADYDHLCSALRKGMEKVISTIGIHEVRGYARQFSAIGLKPEIAEILGVESYFGSEKGGVGFAELDDDANERKRILQQSEDAKPAKTFRFYPKVWKAANAASTGKGGYDEYSRKVRELEAENPISLRHIMELESDRPPIPVEQADPSVGHHDYPIVIASMSFGSQSETAFRAYAEAAKQINILSINGEGGEPHDMIGKYPLHRGQQVASGRFGVTSDLINSSYLVEIKIGQGAKPGEGGHLPARKVTEKVAAARNATTGTDLISPSNNHDLYSIEDLAGLVDELKTANPDVRVAVKVPVVPNIGTIGVGIAKAGADIITLSGFEGGTGAARSHALRHVGLPSDIGTRAVHRALMEAGIRNRVEIWADGGYRHGWDIVKLHCLGANRVGFGTLAMVSLGCTICRGCQLDTCHVGIATQIETTEQAEMHGLKKFTPQVYDQAVEACARFFQAMGEEVRQITAQLGFERTQDLVGRSDLLVQSAAFDRLDLTELITPLEEFLDLEPIDLPVAETVDARAEAGIIVSRPIEMPVKEASKTLAALVPDVCGGGGRAAGSEPLRYQYPRPTNANDRVLGTELAGGISRERIFNQGPDANDETLVNVKFDNGSVAGGGLGAFNVWGVDIDVVGGAQDGVGKCMFGGSVSVLKGLNKFGKRVNGSVGKSFAYGAQRGRLFVQGDADSRFCIRLSGADIVIGGEPSEPVDDSRGCLADRANIKGFAFEYMTAGRAVVLGDPGPWACAGMTGGRVYMRHWPEMGLTKESLTRRLGKGAKAVIMEIDAEGVLDIQELLEHYAGELRESGQADEAERMLALAADASENFLMCVPESEQADPSISTE